MSTSRALAFGDLEAGLWGVAWIPAPDDRVAVAVCAGSTAKVVSAALTRKQEADEWRLDGEGIELALSASGSPVSSGDPQAGLEGFDQLCRVTGTLTLDGAQHEVSCLGWRGARSGLVTDKIESFRQVSAWFEPDEGLALLALRPRKARGQESDIVAAAVLEPEPVPPVADPRLSTTYTEAGLPSRAGLELWLEEGEPDADGGDERPEQYPRRAAGVAVSAGLDWETTSFALHAAPLHWHSRGRDGAGVYLLGRRSA